MNAHPAAELFPMMEGIAFASFAADIKTNGLRNAIVTLNGQILDGRNRLAACELVGVEPRFVEWDGTGSPTAWVMSVNRQRRHLTPSQCSMIAAAALPMLEAEARGNSLANLKKGDQRPDRAKLPTREDTGRARDKAAEGMGVSPRSVEAAKQVSTRAAPEVSKAVRDGKIAVSDAAKVLDRAPEEQAALLAQVEAGESSTLANAAAKAAPGAVASDRIGQVIDPSIAPAFSVLNRRLAAVVAGIKKATAEWKGIEEELISAGGARVMEARRFGFLRSDIGKIAEAGKMLELGAAHALCPYCRGDGECEACQGGGWTDRGSFESAPPELRGVAK